MSRKKIAIVGVALVGIGAVVAFAAPGPRGWHEGGWHDGHRGWHERHEGRGGPGSEFGPGFGRGPGMGFGMGPGDGRGMRPGMTQADLDADLRARFARIDVNNDGVLDKAEIEAALGERRGGRGGPRGERVGRGAERLQAMDANRDGKVTREEFLARLTARFAEADLDGDGRLTDADLPPMMRGRGAIERMAREGGRGPMGFLQGVEVSNGAISREAVLAAAGRQFDRLDADRNGALDQADRDASSKEGRDYAVRRFIHAYGGTASGTVTREQFIAKGRQRFAERDLDGDGRLGRGEVGGREGLRERFQRWRGEHGPMQHDREPAPSAPPASPKQ